MGAASSPRQNGELGGKDGPGTLFRAILHPWETQNPHFPEAKPPGHSQGAAATLVPLGLLQDDVQDMSVGRGNVMCEAADTGEDLGFCRDSCEPERVSSS